MMKPSVIKRAAARSSHKPNAALTTCQQKDTPKHLEVQPDFRPILVDFSNIIARLEFLREIALESKNAIPGGNYGK